MTPRVFYFILQLRFDPYYKYDDIILLNKLTILRIADYYLVQQYWLDMRKRTGKSCREKDKQLRANVDEPNDSTSKIQKKLRQKDATPDTFEQVGTYYVCIFCHHISHLEAKRNINILTNTIRKFFYVFQDLRHIFNAEMKRIIYLALVQSILCYGIVFWGQAYESHIHSLNITLNNAYQ
ncbi:Reverse transcriptase domain-containing protein [Aphis craccivora]|uniref:Reverse transcriptase domain-containing protein n=1 Tax=Aphis craccivora TaxID=307492 RepID=A0A6G0YPN7_APHCR|nr:Reverse transcriptase domain-containing protein [Aphis craccivora]